MEKTHTVEFGSVLSNLLPGTKSVDDIQFRIMIDNVEHPDVQALMQMLHQITVKFHDGKYPIPANIEFIESFVDALDKQASQQFRLCLRWSHALGKVDGDMLLQIRANQYEHAAPIGYTTQ